MVATVAIPWLTGTRDRRARRRRQGRPAPLRAAHRGRGAIARVALSVARRLVAGRVSLAIEFDLRNLIYRHLQSLELAFFDRQQTGQLMSRATVDLQSVRFFLGYGLIFITQSALTILLAAVAMFALQPGLAALALIPVPFVVLVATRYGRRSRPALQEVQQRIAELTADVEENVSGVRVVKAFAAEPRQLDALRAQRHARVRPVDDRDPAARVLQPVHRLPAERRAGGDPARRRAPGDQRQPHARRLHRLLHVPADADRPDAPARHRARDGAARDGVGRAAVRDPRPRAAADLAARRAAAARRPRPGRAARRHVPVRDRPGAGAARHRPRRRGGDDGRAGRRHRLGQDDARAAARAALRRQRGRRADRRRRRARRRPRRRCATRSASSTTTRSCSARPCTTTSPTGGRRRRARRSSAPPSARRRPGSSPSCPTATTRGSASAG